MKMKYQNILKVFLSKICCTIVLVWFRWRSALPPKMWIIFLVLYILQFIAVGIFTSYADEMKVYN